jgi:hypothetical protein
MVAKKVDELPDAWVEPKEPVSERDALTVTLKAGGGYDAPWLVFHANGIPEAIEWLQHDDLEELQDLAARRGKEFAKAFGGPAAASKAPASSGGGWSKPKASAGSSERPDDTCPVHNCDLEFVDAFNNPRTGKSTSARMACPVPKCYKKTYWLNDDGTWSLKEQ